jgi:hypothetical protein
MSNRLLGKIMACILAVLLPAATLSAETRAGMLYATNTVMLNGVGASRSSAVYSGDTIQTPADSAVTLTVQGSTVMVGPSSLLVYQGDAVRLNSGTTMVSTEKRMKTQVQKLLVAPASEGRSTYRVARGNGKVLIAALRGSVTISDGSSVKTVAEGNTTTVADPLPAPQAPGATPGAGGGNVGGISTGLAVGLGIAAGLAAALIAIETTKEPVSGP